MKNIIKTFVTYTYILTTAMAVNVVYAKEPIVKVVLLAGQSNMAGVGDYDKLTPNDYVRIAAASKRVKLSFNGGEAEPLSYKKAGESTIKKYQLTKSFGPELFIGVGLAEKFPNNEILLIKTAQGGTSLYGAWNAQWSKEKADLLETKAFKKTLKLYDLHLNNIKHNLAKLTASGKKYELLGFAWMQGENDAAKEISARSYQANLEKLIASYRHTLKQPKMPFIIGQINSNYGDFPLGPEMVRAAQKNVAETDEYAEYIATSMAGTWLDYPKHFDVHYNTDGQRRLGQQFAKKLIGLIEK